MIVDVVRSASFVKVTRECRLPYPGQVLVEKGMEVTPGDIIAEAQIPSRVMILDIAKGLGLSPEETKSCLIREIEESLEEGDVIAQCEKKIPRLFRAPVDGKIISYQRGQMALATNTAVTAVRANMMGKVEEVIPEYGVIISAQGGLIQGMWGNGHAGTGILQTASSGPDAPIISSELEDLSPNTILVGGYCLDEDFLKECQAKEIAGLVLSSVSTNLLSNLRSLTFPVILFHGFGEIPMDKDVFDILQSSTGSLVSANAHQSDCSTKERPEVIIPKEEGDLDRDLGFRKKLEIGDRVRIISGRAIYQVGRVVELLEKEQIFDNGLILPAALVKLKSLEKIKVPQQNLLVVG
jgi:hypothetical protein